MKTLKEFTPPGIGMVSAEDADAFVGQYESDCITISLAKALSALLGDEGLTPLITGKKKGKAYIRLINEKLVILQGMDKRPYHARELMPYKGLILDVMNYIAFRKHQIENDDLAKKN